MMTPPFNISARPTFTRQSLPGVDGAPFVWALPLVFLFVMMLSSKTESFFECRTLRL
jgi:hypothetical protein